MSKTLKSPVNPIFAMSSGLESLHKVLKDEKRRKIVTLLNEKGSLSYTDFMNSLGIDSTGKLNYHLKILNELITKREDGLYILTDKGKLAVRLVQELGKEKAKPKSKLHFREATILLSACFRLQ